MREKLKKYLLFIFIFVYIMTFIIMLLSFYDIVSIFTVVIALFILGVLIGIVYSINRVLEYVELFNMRHFIKRLSIENREDWKPEKIFKINDIVEMRLIRGKTYIYIKGERFMQCIYLLLNVFKDDMESYNDFDNIDDAAKYLDCSLERTVFGETDQRMDSETEFWGHCSNIQAFFENNLSTNILHSNIAFPLLKELCKVKYKPAYFKFREEIVRRFNAGNENVKEFLYIEGYFTYLNKEELECLDLGEYDKLESMFKDVVIGGLE